MRAPSCRGRRLEVAIDCRGLTQHPYGVARYQRALLEGLAANDVSLHAIFDGEPGALDGLPSLHVHVVPLVRPIIIWEQDHLACFLERLKPDLYHAAAVPALPARASCAGVVTLHDVLPVHPEHGHPELDKRAYILLRWQISLQRADATIVHTRSGREDACRLLGIDRGRVSVVPLAVDATHWQPAGPAACARVEQAFGLVPAQRGPAAGYFVAVSWPRKNKNHARLAEAWLQLPEPLRRAFPLVLVGAAPCEFEQALGRATVTSLMAAGARLPGRISEDDLVALVGCATALVQPSLFEGFGFSALEGMACGTPVAASNRTAVPEVVGDAALTFDPTSVPAIRAALLRLATEPSLRDDLGRRGRARAARFDWAETIAQTLAVYDRALERRAGSAADRIRAIQ